MADLQLGTQLTKDYSVLIESRPVLEETIDNLGLDMTYQALRNSVEITNPEDTRILQLSVNHSDPETAKLLVDELASVSSAYIGDKMEVTPPKIIEEGEVPTEKTSPSMRGNVMKGMLAGLALACALWLCWRFSTIPSIRKRMWNAIWDFRYLPWFPTVKCQEK